MCKAWSAVWLILYNVCQIAGDAILPYVRAEEVGVIAYQKQVPASWQNVEQKKEVHQAAGVSTGNLGEVKKL